MEETLQKYLTFIIKEVQTLVESKDMLYKFADENDFTGEELDMIENYHREFSKGFNEGVQEVIKEMVKEDEQKKNRTNFVMH